jgi:hypothetical protein
MGCEYQEVGISGGDFLPRYNTQLPSPWKLLPLMCVTLSDRVASPSLVPTALCSQVYRLRNGNDNVTAST